MKLIITLIPLMILTSCSGTPVSDEAVTPTPVTPERIESVDRQKSENVEGVKINVPLTPTEAASGQISVSESPTEFTPAK